MTEQLYNITALLAMGLWGIVVGFLFKAIYDDFKKLPPWNPFKFFGKWDLQDHSDGSSHTHGLKEPTQEEKENRVIADEVAKE